MNETSNAQTRTEDSLPQVKPPMDNLYQNIGSAVSTGVIYARILKKEQPNACAHTTIPSNESDEESTKISVREMVKKFNRQS